MGVAEVTEQERRIRILRLKQAQARAAASAQPTDYRGEGGGRGTSLEAALIGARQGVTFGFGDEINAGVRAGMDWLGGENFGEAYDQRLAHERGLLEQVRGENPAASLGGEITGAILPSLLTGGTTSLVGAGVRGAAGGAAYGFGEGEGGAEDRARNAVTAALIAGPASVVGQGVGNAIAKRVGTNAAAKAAPSVDDLKGEATALYRAAEASGVQASAQQTDDLANAVTRIAQGRNIVMPGGEYADKYGDIKDIARVVEQYRGQVMTPGQMKVVRESFQEAAKQPGREGKIGKEMLDTLDQWTQTIAPELRQGDAFYAKAMRGQKIEQTVELARNRSGQFSGSGFENALRTEFRQLHRRILKGQEKGFSEAEIEAIRKVAEGGPVENVLRWIGKAAPTGVVSMGIGGGMPFLIGNALAGPGVGMAAGAGTMAVGGLGRMAATAAQSRNAEIASALARSGGQLPVTPSPAVQQIVRALQAGQRPLAAQ